MRATAEYFANFVTALLQQLLRATDGQLDHVLSALQEGLEWVGLGEWHAARGSLSVEARRNNGCIRTHLEESPRDCAQAGVGGKKQSATVHFPEHS